MAAMPSRKKSSRRRQWIRPAYADAFQCIGPACEDTCCSGWSVFIDKDTYAKYQTIPDGPLRTIIDHRLEVTGSANAFEFARVRLEDGGSCPFLAGDRLCSIQKAHGEEFLSRTCSQYPRAAKMVDGVEERTLLLSCPEAARLVLLNRDLVPSANQEASRTGAWSGFRSSLADNHATSAVECFGLVRTFCVLVLQDDSYPLWQRVLLISMFAKRLETITSQGQWSLVPAMLHEHAGIVVGDRLKPALHSIPGQPLAQLGVLLTLIADRAGAARNHDRFTQCMDEFASGIRFRPGAAAAELVGNYAESFAMHYLPWLATHEFLLKNYLLNYVFAHLFPFGKSGAEQGRHPFREARLLCFQFGLLQGLLAGMARFHESSFGEVHAVKLIQSFSKTVEHNSGLLNRIELYFAQCGLNDIDGIAALLQSPAQGAVIATQRPVLPV